MQTTHMQEELSNQDTELAFRILQVRTTFRFLRKNSTFSDTFWVLGSCHKRQKRQAPIRNRKMRKAANAKVHNRYTNLT